MNAPLWHEGQKRFFPLRLKRGFPMSALRAFAHGSTAIAVFGKSGLRQAGGFAVCGKNQSVWEH